MQVDDRAAARSLCGTAPSFERHAVAGKAGIFTSRRRRCVDGSTGRMEQSSGPERWQLLNRGDEDDKNDEGENGFLRIGIIAGRSVGSGTLQWLRWL